MIGEGGNQYLSVHDVHGAGVGDVEPGLLGSLQWGREQTEVSRCEWRVSTANNPLVEKLRPWLHWVTVWEDGKSLWTGPIQRVHISRSGGTSVSCRDTSTFMWRTRIPLTKQWVGNDPTVIANELWVPMLQLHQVKVTPVVLESVGQQFSYSATADSKRLFQAMDDLVKIGLEWTVVKGTPVLGVQPDGQVGDTLQEDDFLEELDRIRDGTDTFNDVKLQGQNYQSTQVAELAGLRLQTVVSLDDVFGVSNIQNAARQYAQSTARIRDTLDVPPLASLSPRCGLSLDDLVPGAHFGVSAQGIENMMVLKSMQVTTTPGKYDVQVTLETVKETVELTEKVTGGAL